MKGLSFADRQRRAESRRFRQQPVPPHVARANREAKRLRRAAEQEQRAAERSASRSLLVRAMGGTPWAADAAVAKRLEKRGLFYAAAIRWRRALRIAPDARRAEYEAKAVECDGKHEAAIAKATGARP